VLRLAFYIISFAQLDQSQVPFGLRLSSDSAMTVRA